MLLALALAAGCSVIEDRIECPCTLRFDWSGVSAQTAESLWLGVASSAAFAHTNIVYSDVYGDIYLLSVPKTSTWINVYATSNGESLENYLNSAWSELTIPLRSQCPALYKFSQALDLDAYDDQVDVPVDICKNYCEITITLYAAEDGVDFSLAIVGSINGYDILGEPSAGTFRYEPAYEDGGVYHCRVPRQTDDSLILEVFDEDQVLRDFAIGEYISESGYDWTDANLKDIEMTINYSKSNVSFVMMGWVKTIDLEVVI